MPRPERLGGNELHGDLRLRGRGMPRPCVVARLRGLMDPASSSTAVRRFAPWAIGLVATLLALIGSWRSSPTEDEPTYVGHGNYILERGDFRAPVLLWQPPLALYVQATGLAFADIDRGAFDKAKDAQSLTGLGDALIFESKASPETVLRAARWPIAVATGLAAALAAWIAGTVGGTIAMVIAGLLVAASPIVYGHGGLATTDLVAALGVLAASAGLVAMVRSPPRSRATGDAPQLVLAGVLLGVALLAKHTAITLIPLAVGVAWWTARRGGRSRPAALGRAALLLLAAGLVVWIGYGFDVGVLVQPDSAGDLLAKASSRIPLPRSLIEWFAREVPVPAPRWFQSLVYQSGKQHGRLYFRYFEEISKVGWWTYFPVVTLGKLTLGSIGLVGIAAATLRRRRLAADEVVLLLAFALPFAAAVVSRHNLGVRHVLPALLPLFVFAAVRIGRATSDAAPRGLFLAASCLLCIHVGEGVLAQGNPIAWWNLAYGGTPRGWRVAADSNADWGQGLWALRDVARRENLEHVHFIAFAPVSALAHLDEPRLEPMQDEWWTRPAPEDGWLAISTSALWYAGRPPITDAAPDAFVGGCYRLYKLPLAAPR